jgi:hypothetical protein
MLLPGGKDDPLLPSPPPPSPLPPQPPHTTPNLPQAFPPATHLEVGGYCHVNFFGLGQVQVCHDVNELLLRVSQAGVEGFLLVNGADRLPLVVVGWIDQGIAWQGEKLAMNRVIQLAGTACRTPVKQRVTNCTQ